MRVGIIGNGVVGQATGRAWAPHVEELLTWDVDPKRRNCRLLCEVLDCADWMEHLIFVCLPETQLDAFFSVPEFTDRDLGPINKRKNFVIRSTVQVGTTRQLKERFGLRNVVHMPEFLTARTATWDAANPAQIVIGSKRGWKSCDSRTGLNDVPVLLHNACVTRFPGVSIRHVLFEESELIKLVVNAFGAVKVTFFNEIEGLCRKLGVSWATVREGVLSDGRVGSEWTRVPGPDGKRGFGGACLPKDLQHLIDCLGAQGCGMDVSIAARDGNSQHHRSRS